MKVYLLYGLVLIILASTIYNNLKDDYEMHSHEQFFKEVRAFMNRGDRNTAADGALRDQRLTQLEKRLEELEK